jgi:hypothetical protein
MQQQYGMAVEIPMTVQLERGFAMYEYLYAVWQHELKKVGLVPDGPIQFLRYSNDCSKLRRSEHAALARCGVRSSGAKVANGQHAAMPTMGGGGGTLVGRVLGLPPAGAYNAGRNLETRVNRG